MTASWLYNNWKSASLLLKTYLIIAVIVLMAITSLGIFGFLSRAHIEQNASAQENIAQIDRIKQDIVRLESVSGKAEARVKQLESTGVGADVNVQNQINTEQSRIDSVFSRIQPAIDEQNRIIDSQIKILTEQVQNIDAQLSTLQRYIDTNEVAKAQSMVGTRADGNWGPGTAQSVKLWQAQKEQAKQQLANRIEEANLNNPTVKAAREEIQRLRKNADLQVNESNKLINRLREQLGKVGAEDLNKEIAQQQKIVKETNAEIEGLTEKKFKLESSVRKIESEVGPIKYIANFIYDNQTNSEILEKAVVWMIIVIVLVFDPLAVLLLIAANTSLKSQGVNKNIVSTGNRFGQIIKNMLPTNGMKIKRAKHDMVKVPVEVVKEVPVEVIREVEKLVEVVKEVPVEVIREVEVIKEVNTESHKLVYVSQWDDGRETYVHAHGQIGFGTTFPNENYKERYFIRTDVKPSRVYEFINDHWEPVGHNVLLDQNTDIYTLHLRDQISNSELTEADLTEVELNLVRNKRIN